MGPSGSGKSTLLRLLLGFETPKEGVIALDGQDLATLDVQEVRRQMGVVLQDTQVFPGDASSNIVGLSSGLTIADAWNSRRARGLAEDIESMPMGMHTMISEGGGGLSSGQRAAVDHRPSARQTSATADPGRSNRALDNQTQAVVSRNIQSRLKGTSRLVIAHRLSTIVDADRIYVLNRGRITQSGTFSQLINEPGAVQGSGQETDARTHGNLKPGQHRGADGTIQARPARVSRVREAGRSGRWPTAWCRVFGRGVRTLERSLLLVQEVTSIQRLDLSGRYRCCGT